MSLQDKKLIVPDGLKLLPFQEETVRKTLAFFEINESHAAYVANEMGLGKSVTSLVTHNTIESKRTLIVCPSVMKLVWKEEAEKWCNLGQEFYNIGVLESSKDAFNFTIPNSHIVIISYGLLLNKEIHKYLTSIKFDLLILDEAHYIKSHKAKRTKATLSLWRNCEYKICLSGTPFLRDITDCYTTFSAILPRQFTNYFEFAGRYANQRRTPWGIKYEGIRNADELSKIIRKNFYIRYKKEDVLKDLPPKMWSKVPLPNKYSVKVGIEESKKLAKEKQLLLDSIENNTKIQIPASLAQHRHMQGIKKVPYAIEFATEFLEQEIPIVVFAHHKEVIRQLAEGLAKYKPVIITGETSSEERQKAIQIFQGGETNIFIGNLMAAGVGVTLVRAQNVILVEASWSPAENEQAVSRCHRIGSKGQVTAHWLVVQDSIDEDVLNVVIRKTKEFNKVLDEAA